MLTKKKILKALKPVEDPNIHRGIVDLNMVRNIKIKRRTVYLEIALATGKDSVKEKIKYRIKDALHEIGARQVGLHVTSMTEKERTTLSKKLSNSHIVSNAGPRPNLMKTNPSTEFIAISSGKGGVGKSTVTVNLAVALSKQGWRVGLIDADMYGYSVPKMMGITEEPEIIGGSTSPLERFGVHVMSLGFFNHGNEPVIWRGPMLGKTLRYFIEGVHWPELDYMLIDLPPGTGDIALDVLEMFPKSKDILVTTPHTTASYIAERAGTMSVQNQRELLGVVENMSYILHANGEKEYPFGKGGAKRVAKILRTDFLVQVPIGVPDNDSGEALAVYGAETEQAKVFRDLAKQVVSRHGQHNPASKAE
jgi:ATP-binding protein involved in chromosome partitioning